MPNAALATSFVIRPIPLGIEDQTLTGYRAASSVNRSWQASE